MKTLAVVIGNNDYYEPHKLNNAINDAQAMAGTFEKLGFDVRLFCNCTSAQCTEVLSLIDKEITNFEATIFFFAGHGFQMDGENYLTSIGCQIPPGDKYNCHRNSITLSELLDIFRKHPNKINIVIVDACRKSFGRGASEVFAPVQAPQGTLIAFSTSPEESAKDSGFEGHSIYTGALLKYIGREMLSVEELFKKVRKTVFTLTGGRQTPWEHTSLIGDFYFNAGQLVHSTQLTYSEEVVKDVNFIGKADDITYYINEVRIHDWNRQNPAFDRLLKYKVGQLDKNQQFILGRNLLQAGEAAFRAVNFFQDLRDSLIKYNSDGENHVLNGILFEVYFDSYGEFRKDNFKMHHFETVMALRKLQLFKPSFDFINTQLQPFLQFRPFWLPVSNDNPIDVDVQVTQETIEEKRKGKVTYDIIHTIKAMSWDITNQLQRYGLYNRGVSALKSAIASYLAVPEYLVVIHCAHEIKRIAFMAEEDDSTI